ncbi:MAG TPA: tetratricopeptide repeat protein [Candidatus Obscuribacterales bacterium]
MIRTINRKGGAMRRPHAGAPVTGRVAPPQRIAPRIWFALVVSLMLAIPSMAYDFPGQGSAADWSDALPYYNLGNKYLNQQRYGEAAEKYREAIQRYQYDPDFYINMGVAYQKLEDYSDAEQAFKAASQLNDKDYSIWMNLGNAYLKENRLKETLTVFERALKCNPPAADRKFLLDDISDIHKVLRNTGQEPMPEPKTSPHRGAHGAPTTHGGGGRKPAFTGESPALHGSGGRKPAPPVAPTRAPATTDWGYK